MIKYHKYVSIALGILFLISLQEFANPRPIFRFLIVSSLLYLALVAAYNYWYLKQLDKLNWWVYIRPLLLIIGGFGLFLIAFTPFLRGVFLLSAVCLISFVEYFLSYFSENLLMNETLLIAFGFFVTIAAFNQYFPAFSTLNLFALFVGIYLLTRAFNEFTPVSNLKKMP